jgi:MFS family permease
VFLLSNPDYFNVPASKIGYTAGLLNFVGYPGAIIGSIFVGYAFDIFGRRFTLAASLYACSILIAIVPFTSPNIFPWLVVIRVTI